jgi:hypothetical protein
MTTTAFPNCTPLSVSDPDYDRLSKLVRESYPRACITMIDRITIPHAQEAYEEWRNKVSDKTEYTVFHGTRFANVASICQHNFQPSEGRIMAYGFGIYFAKHFAYSWSFTDSIPTDEEDSNMSYIFVCNILPGTFTQGTVNRQPPPGYDSQVNALPDPFIFAIPQACMMIPRFLIRFSKEAERTYQKEKSVQQEGLDLKRFSPAERAAIRKMQSVVRKSEKKVKK